MFTRSRALTAAATLSLVALLPAAALAGPPTDQLKGRVDRVLKILEDPEMRKEARAADRRAAIRTVAAEVFDFEEISKRSLGRHWQSRSPAERQEFIGLFGDLLERAYINRIEQYSGEKIEYVGEALDGDTATVRTRIVTRNGTQIPVEYRMLRQGDRWRAYDVLVENVSLIANYRSQFNSVIQRSSYDGLVKALRAKQEEGATVAARPAAAATPAAARPAPAAPAPAAAAPAAPAPPASRVPASAPARTETP